MKEYFEVLRILEQEGYSGIEMAAGGLLVMALDSSGKVCLFDSCANPLDARKFNISIDKNPDKEDCYTIRIEKYKTEYDPKGPQNIDSYKSTD